MSTLSTSVRFLRKAAALLLLPWLAWSCQVVADGDYEDEPKGYIINADFSQQMSMAADPGTEYGKQK